jgi:nanoRNase/pAp phosphatase (c-di-AMP/oligoRNAs hydrolase)
MELTTEQQIFDQLQKANRVLIALPESLTADSLASALALKLFLAKLDKEADVISSGPVPKSLHFLPGFPSVNSDLSNGKSLVVVLNTATKKLEELSYQATEDKVSIFLKSKGEIFTPEDISFGADKAPVDVVVILGAKSLEDLGKLFEKHTDLFFETPKINIDNKAGNEYFGSINFVDVTASSVAEILATLFEKYEKQLVDEDMATCLLTGIITQTNSFQHVQTTPKAFVKASELISLGGRQQEIVKNIYKTKSLPLLKLWGRALARMKIDEELGVVHSLLNASDFEKAGGNGENLLPVLKEFLDNISSYKIVGLLCELEDGVTVLTALHLQVSTEKFLTNLGAPSHSFELPPHPFKILEIKLPSVTLQETESKFLEAVKGL